MNNKNILLVISSLPILILAVGYCYIEWIAWNNGVILLIASVIYVISFFLYIGILTHNFKENKT